MSFSHFHELKLLRIKAILIFLFAAGMLYAQSIYFYQAIFISGDFSIVALQVFPPMSPLDGAVMRVKSYIPSKLRACLDYFLCHTNSIDSPSHSCFIKLQQRSLSVFLQKTVRLYYMISKMYFPLKKWPFKSENTFPAYHHLGTFCLGLEVRPSHCWSMLILTLQK